MTTPCPWYPFAAVLQPWLGITVILLGGLGAIMNIALMTSLVFGKLASSFPHVNLLLLVSCAITGLGRGLLAGFPFSVPSIFAGGWIFGHKCCQLFATFGQFFFATQMVVLATLGLERYREARACRAFTRGKHVKGLIFRPHVATAICWVFGAFWALLPLFKFGSYSCDVTNTSCDLDWRLIDRYNQGYYNTLFALFGVSIPVTMAVFWLSRASAAINAPDGQYDPWNPVFVQAQQTKTIMALTYGMILSWVPKALLAIWIIVAFPTNRAFLQYELQPTLMAIITISSEISPIIAPFVLFLHKCFLRGSVATNLTQPKTVKN